MIPPPPPPRVTAYNAPPPPSNTGDDTRHSDANFASALPASSVGSGGTGFYEPYGEIQPMSSATSGIANRRRSDVAPSFSYASGVGSSYNVPPSSYSKPTTEVQQERRVSALTSEEEQYSHNTVALWFLIPALFSVLWWHDSPTLLQLFLFVALVLYGLDLINARDSLAVAFWISALVLTMASAFFALLQIDDADAIGSKMVLHLLRLSVEGILFCSWACWCNLQFRWLYKEVPSVASGLEKALHSLLPPLCACIFSYHFVRLSLDSWGVDRVAIMLPHAFTVSMAFGMVSLGCITSSYGRSSKAESSNFVITSFSARIHSMVLLMVPGSIHTIIFRHRIFSRYASYDELNDLILVWAVPYLLHYAIVFRPETGPYQIMFNVLFPKTGQNTLRGTLVPMVVSLCASLSLQQRYLIPLCSSVSYQFNGHDQPPVWVISLYLTLATSCSLFAFWTWNRKSAVTDELLFGEYHEDAVQLAVSASGFLLGKAFGFPWNLTPLPILAFLGLSVWITTRMLRYLSIFLFVVHAAGVVLFSYRFASIDMTIPLALPGIEVRLIGFGMIEVFSSILIGLVVGFAIRPAGGFGTAIMKRIDFPGLILIAYVLAMTIIELTLLRRPVPHDLIGMESNAESDNEMMLYDHATLLLTSMAVIILTIFLQSYRVISSKSAVVATSIAFGEALAAIVDASEIDGKIRSATKNEQVTHKLFYRSMAASVLLIVVMAPRAVLRPIHVKSSSRYKRSLSDGKPLGNVPSNALLTIAIYSLAILPLVLAVLIPTILIPLVMALSAHYGGGAYYNLAPPIAEMVGLALCIWGVACLSMLNHYLPDGGGEIWKKVSALTLLMGAGIAYSSPAVPEWIAGDDEYGVSNPYASISSLGIRLVNQGRNRTGGWGILSAGLATLLAMTGPLELRERRHPSGRKDKLLLLRLMIFSTMFGSGLSWFITVTTMNQESFPVMLITGLACMVVSFFGTVSCVLAYFLELENFDEVDQMAKVWGGSFFVFAVITGMASLLAPNLDMHMFGSGGWLATYLTVSSCLTLALAVALSLRKTKNSSSRGLGNLSCILSYGFAVCVLFGRYGVVGLDRSFDFTSVLGLPASIFGTFLLSPILLFLEGEASHERQSRVTRLSSPNNVKPAKSLGITLKNLQSSNRLTPMLIGTFVVLFGVSLYTILLRGSFLFGGIVSKGHVDLFANLFSNQENTLAVMAKKSLSHSRALVISARVAGSGFWTSDNVFGPLLHLAGLAAAIPSAILLVSDSWFGSHPPKSQVMLAVPLNLIPLLLCKGIPSLTASALLGAIGGVVQLASLQRSHRRSRMRI